MSRVSLVAVKGSIKKIGIDGSHIYWVHSYSFDGQQLEILCGIPTEATAHETEPQKVRFKPGLNRLRWGVATLANCSAEFKNFELHVCLDLDVDNLTFEFQEVPDV